MKETLISFVGLGIDGFTVDNVAFKIGDFPVYWYGIIITFGIVFAFLYACFRGKYESVVSDDLVDIAFWTVLPGIAGARLYYVLTSLDQYIPHPFNLIQFFKNIINLRQGGLAIYGGIICGILGIIIASKIKKINTLKLMDMIGPGVMMAQAIGRWGNFFNAEAHGGIVSEGHPLYFLRMGLLPNEDSLSTMYFYHPTFLYESLWNVVGFILINLLYKKKKFNGQIACMYLSWYGFGRMFIEGLRTDSLYVGSFRISQVVGFVCFVIFGALLVWGLIYSKKFEKEGYEPSKFDKYLIPTLVEPVFFEKKALMNNESESKKTIEEDNQDNGTNNGR